jgi:hypothetical protein
MSELAFNQSGDLFDVPAVVTGWRVRRLKPRGAPELVYGKDGRPLTIPIESGMDELRDAVAGVLGKYRLDPVNDDGRVVDGTPPAYVQMVKSETLAEPVAIASARDDANGVIRDAMRLNTELAKSIVDKFPEMMHAAAELLRAADGAGLPARQPREIDGEEDEDEIEEAAPQKPGVDIAEIAAKVIPPLVMAIASGDKSRLPSFGEMLDWRKAVPKNKEKTTEKTATKPSENKSVWPNPTEVMARVGVILDKLTPEERSLAIAFAQEITSDERATWFAELAPLSDDEAVAKVRSILGANGAGGAS